MEENKKNKIKKFVFFVILLISLIGYKYYLVQDNINKSEIFAKNYILKILNNGYIDEIEKYTLDISLYHKIGFFLKNICIREIPQNKLKEIIHNVSYDIEHIKGLKKEDKEAEMNIRMNIACKDNGAYNVMPNLFSHVKILSNTKHKFGRRILLEIFSKKISKKFKIAIVVKNTKFGLNAYSIDYFPDIDFFYKLKK